MSNGAPHTQRPVAHRRARVRRGGDARQLRVADDLLTVQLYPEAVADELDLELIPLAARPIHRLLRSDRGTHLRRHLRIHAVAVDLAGANRPHPDVDLALPLGIAQI